MTIFEWSVWFIVEGLLPKELPKSLSEEVSLEKFIEDKTSKERKACLSIRILRESTPSDNEPREVEKIGLNIAKKFVDLYSLFIGRLRLTSETPFSVEQITPYNKRRYISQSISLYYPIILPDDIFNKSAIMVQKFETSAKQDFLALALSHYALSLWSESKSSFVNLIICIEALYNTNPQEIRKTISHRVANLLGATEELRSRIFLDIYTLYKKRNDLVHGIKPVAISDEDIKHLRIYSNYSLQAFLRINPKKSSFVKKLDESIYCERTRTEIQERIKDVLSDLMQELNKS